MTGKKHLYTEREKIRHTTHWDLDYLPREEIEAYCVRAAPERISNTPRDLSRRRQGRVGLGLIAAGLLLLGCAVAAGRLLSG